MKLIHVRSYTDTAVLIGGVVKLAATMSEEEPVISDRVVLSYCLLTYH